MAIQTLVKKMMGQVVTLLAVSVTLLIAIGCEQLTSSSSTVSNSAITSTTPTQYPPANPTDVVYMIHASGLSSYELETLRLNAPDKYDYLLNVAKKDEQLATEIAQAPTPTVIAPTSPTTLMHSVGATPTVQVGIIECGSNRPGAEYVPRSCWRGVLNGQYVSVSTGLLRGHGTGKAAEPAVPDKWVLRVYNEAYPSSTDPAPNSYDIPTGIGSAIITSFSSTKLTLSQADYYGKLIPSGKIVIFDLASRQFIAPTRTP